MELVFVFFFFLFQARVFPCTHAWPRTHSVDQADLKLDTSYLCHSIAGVKGMWHNNQVQIPNFDMRTFSVSWKVSFLKSTRKTNQLILNWLIWKSCTMVIAIEQGGLYKHPSKPRIQDRSSKHSVRQEHLPAPFVCYVFLKKMSSYH